MKSIIVTSIILIAGMVQAQPWTPHVIWDKRGAGDQSHMGDAVDPLGDQNNDGYADFAVLSGGTGTPGQVSEARYDLFHGGNPPDTIPYMTFKGTLSPRRDFLEANVIGDVNGDGYKDWWTWNYVPGDTVAQVDIFFGGPSADTIPDAYFHFPATGWDWMDPIGDINGDGYDDFYLYNGGGAGLPLDRTSFFFGGNPLDTIPDLVIYSNPRGSQSSLPRAHGDINGDGYGDFETSSNIWNGTYIYYGSAHPDTIPTDTLAGVGGYTMAIVRDLNGDGRDDLVNSGCPDFRVHLGSDNISLMPDFNLHFPGCNGSQDFFTTAWDYNRDGINDLVAIDRTIPLSWGTLRLYLGYHWLNPDAIFVIEGREPPLNLVGITTAAGLGDINGDGIQDLAIGATNGDNDGTRGRVVILSGDTTLRVDAKEPRAKVPSDLSVTVYPNPFNAETTISLNLPAYTSAVQLTIFNLLGQIAQQAAIRNAVGTVEYHLNAGVLSTGVYLLRVTAGSLTSTQKLVVLK
jgi:hypothetical protein